MSSSMRNFMEAYLAVHNTEAKEKLNSDRDSISEMNLSSLDDSDLEEIAESILQEMFDEGYSVDSVLTIFSEMFVDSNIVGRQKKIERLCESFYKVFKTITSKAPSIAIEEFSKYRNNKKLQESWSARFNQEKRIKRTHNQLVAQESMNVKNLILQLVEKTGNSYLETDPKKRKKNNEDAVKKMKNMGSMNNPHFGDGPTGSMSSEEVSNIRKGWGDAYASIYEKKHMDPVGQEDGDIDNDGDKDSSDDYLMNRRKAIGKAMGKKGKCENCGGKGCEKCEDSIDEATAMAKRGYDETKLRKRAGGGESADRATALENKPTYGNKKAAQQRSNLARKQRGDFRDTASSGGSGSRFSSNDPNVIKKQRARAAQRGALTPNEKRQLNMGEDFELFSEAELEAIQTKVDSWED